MLNLVLNENSKNFFEVNKANLFLEGFTATPKLLLLGGSEIDIRELYQKMKLDLVAEKEKVIEQRSILKQMSQNITNMKDDISELDQQLSLQKGEIEKKGNY